jgi:NTP pyrophosphatase (non-canonical NTP hydrolase)
LRQGELLELFLWKDASDASVEKLKGELADVLSFSFLLAHKLRLDVSEIVLAKIKENDEKYPVAKSKGNATKYTDL